MLRSWASKVLSWVYNVLRTVVVMVEGTQMVLRREQRVHAPVRVRDADAQLRGPRHAPHLRLERDAGREPRAEPHHGVALRSRLHYAGRAHTYLTHTHFNVNVQ